MRSFAGNQTFIIGTLLPLLTKDIIYGGSQPYIVYVNDPIGMILFIILANIWYSAKLLQINVLCFKK